MSPTLLAQFSVSQKRECLHDTNAKPHVRASDCTVVNTGGFYLTDAADAGVADVGVDSVGLVTAL